MCKKKGDVLNFALSLFYFGITSRGDAVDDRTTNSQVIFSFSGL
jgi:hypothetical protein